MSATTGQEAMTTGHTPGPWTAVRNPYFWEIQTEAHGQIGDACASNTIYIDGDLMPSEEASLIAEANARLFAAAPEMLAALKRIVFDWDGEPEDMDEAREAIAKAEGRTALSTANGRET